MSDPKSVTGVFFAVLFVLMVHIPVRSAAASAPSSMPPIVAGHPRLGFHPQTGHAEASRLTKSPLWKAFLQRTNSALSVPEPKAATLAVIISQGALVALAKDDAVMGRRVGVAIEKFSAPILSGDWKEQNDLALNEQVAALAFGYDWAYAYLSPRQRELAARTLVKMCAYGRKEFWFYLLRVPTPGSTTIPTSITWALRWQAWRLPEIIPKVKS
jgi:hypothetical protein